MMDAKRTGKGKLAFAQVIVYGMDFQHTPKASERAFCFVSRFLASIQRKVAHARSPGTSEFDASRRCCQRPKIQLTCDDTQKEGRQYPRNKSVGDVRPCPTKCCCSLPRLLVSSVRCGTPENTMPRPFAPKRCPSKNKPAPTTLQTDHVSSLSAFVKKNDESPLPSQVIPAAPDSPVSILMQRVWIMLSLYRYVVYRVFPSMVWLAG